MADLQLNDDVSPSHYSKYGDCLLALQCQQKFREGNVIKYIVRHEDKGQDTDLLKAIWYIADILERDYKQSDLGQAIKNLITITKGEH